MVASTWRFCLVRAITTFWAISAAVVRLRRHFDANRVAQQALRQLLDLRRHGRREQRRLARRMRRLGEAADVVDEAHVEHAVGLVEHQPRRLGQDHVLLADQVGEPARRGDQHVDARRDLADLAEARDAAEHQRGRDMRALGQHAERFVDLHGELAGRNQHQRARRLGAALGAERDDLGQDRQREGRGLAGAGLGDAQNVAAGELRRNGLDLDRLGFGVAGGNGGLEQRAR